MQLTESSSDTALSESSPRQVTESPRSAVSLKIVIRHLPPTYNHDIFLEQVSPLPEHDFFDFVKADHSLGTNAFSRAYVNFLNESDLFIFTEKFDNYVFVDSRGNEFPAIVEYAPFSKVPKKKSKKVDVRKGTLEQDIEYVKFVESLTTKDENDVALTIEQVLEEIEAKDKANKEKAGKHTTTLIDYLKRRREERKMVKEDRRKKEDERRKKREDERKKRRDRDMEKMKYQQARDTHKMAARHAADDATAQYSGDSDSAQRSYQVLKKREESSKDRKSTPRDSQSSKSESRFEFKKQPKDDSYSSKRESDSKSTRDKDRLSSRSSDYDKRDSRDKRDTDYKSRRDYRDKQNGDHIRDRDRKPVDSAKDYKKVKDDYKDRGYKDERKDRSYREDYKDKGYKEDYKSYRDDRKDKGDKSHKDDYYKDVKDKVVKNERKADKSESKDKIGYIKDESKDKSGYSRDESKDKSGYSRDESKDKSGSGYLRDKRPKHYEETREREKERREKQKKERDRREQIRLEGKEKRDKLNAQNSESKDGGDKKIKPKETDEQVSTASSNSAVEKNTEKASKDSKSSLAGEDCESLEGSDSGRDSSKPARLRYKDRPERQIYNPAQRAAERKRQQQTRGPESTKATSKQSTPEDD